MMHNNDELATREYIPNGKTAVSEVFVDFTVPVIDHFGDMGFALSLALSLILRSPKYRVRFFSEDSDLFQKMLGGKIPERLSYFPLHDWGTSNRTSIRCNFFGYKIQESELFGYENPKKILNFDYLQFHRGTGPANPGISSLHGTEYELGGKKIVHLVPSLLAEGGGVAIPHNSNFMNRGEFLQKMKLPSELSDKKWCSVFVYPNTLERILSFATKHPNWVFFVC